MSQLSTSSPPGTPASVTIALTPALRAGALAAIGTWAVVIIPALIGWVAAPESTLGWFSAVAVGSAIWFLGHGQSIGGDVVAISMAPLLLMLLFVLIARRSARRLLATERAQVRASEWSGVIGRQVVPGFVLGYLAVSAIASLLTLGGPASPGFAAVLGSLIVPLAGLGACLLRPGITDPWDPVRRFFERAPSWVAPAWRLGWRGAWLLLGVGLAVVLLRVLLSLGPVLHVQGEYGVNLVAGLVLALAQLGFSGNLATWGLAFVAGPGFAITTGGVISPSGAHPGLMPLVPVLGALPDQATYPWPMWLVLALPVLAGAGIARWVDDSRAAVTVRDRFVAAAAACLVAVGVVGVLTALGTGSIGGVRLASVGPAAGPLVGALLLETLVGALAWVGLQLWQERRASALADDGA